jgi:hypothetical protein
LLAPQFSRKLELVLYQLFEAIVVLRFLGDRLVDWIATEYNISEEDARCDKEVGVESEQSFIYKVFCSDNEATVTVYVHEYSFAISDNLSIPAYCSESTEVGNKVAYIFTLPCDCDTHPSVVTPTPPPTSYCGYYDISFDESGKVAGATYI